MRDWVERRLADCAEILDSQRIPVSGELRSAEPGATPYYGANGLQGYIHGHIFDEPLILIAEDGGYFEDFETRPIAYRIFGKSWVNNHAHVLRPKAGVEFDFLFYSLEHKNIVSFIKGGTRAKLNQAELRDIKIAFPQHQKAQQRIAAILACIDTAIEKTEALIAKHQQIKAGLMHDLFTRGVLPNGQLRPPRSEAAELYQETAIGWIPRDWQVAPMDSTLSRVIDYRGKTPDKTVSGVPLITAKNVRMGYIDPEPREFIAESDYARWMTRGIPGKGDVLFTTEAPLGNVAQVPTDEPMAYAQRAIILQPAPHIDAAFLAYRLMTEETQQAIQRLASGSTALGIKQSEFRKVMVAYPFNKQEQVDIVRRMQVIDGFLDAQGSIRWKLQQQKLGLMQDLLTGRVQVNTNTV